MKVVASELKGGEIIELNGRFRVIEAYIHKGSATTGTLVHLKLQNTKTGSLKEVRLPSLEKVEVLDVNIIDMEYLYKDGDNFVFMNPITYEEIRISKDTLGNKALFLTEGVKFPVELYENEAVGLKMPDIMEVKVASTGPAIKGQGSDIVYKPATLENGIEIQVPQFIESGDLIKVDVQKLKYIERVKK